MNYDNYLIADSRNLFKIYNEQNLEKADLVLTSPPYYDTKSYSKSNNQIGHNQTYQDYITDTVNVLQQCYKVTNENATLWLIMDTVQRNKKLYPLPFDINSKLEEVSPNNRSHTKGWVLRDIIIWNRPKNLPWHTKGRLKHEFEYILFFSKNDKYKYYVDRVRNIYEYKDWWLTYPERYNPKGRPPSNIWQFSIPMRGWGNSHQKHLCPFPFPLIERILTIGSDRGDVILDPFAGSGSVVGLAHYMDRRAIGLDVSSEYKSDFEKDVLIGAKQYWDDRVNELEKINKKRETFEKTNIKLRKIKAGLQLYKYFKEQSEVNNIKFFFFDNPDNNLSANLVTSSPLDSIFDHSTLADVISQVNSKYGVNICLISEDIKSYNNRDIELIYSYSGKNNHKYQRKLSFPNDADASEKILDSNLIYSDIELNIEDPTHYFEEETEIQAQ